MPHIVNPPAGWFANANNDPAGTVLDNNPLNQLRPGGGIYYLNPGYDGFRAGRITEMLRQQLADGHKISVDDVQHMQADTTLLDAEYFVPWLAQAFADAQSSSVPQLAALAADPRVAEAMRRLAQWDETTPTGIPQGYDASDVNGKLAQPTSRGDHEQRRGDDLRGVAVARGHRHHRRHARRPAHAGRGRGAHRAAAPARHLVDARTESARPALDFFAVSGIAHPDAARDYRLLNALSSGLDMLAGPDFDAAFHRSTDQSTTGGDCCTASSSTTRSADRSACRRRSGSSRRRCPT